MKRKKRRSARKDDLLDELDRLLDLLSAKDKILYLVERLSCFEILPCTCGHESCPVPALTATVTAAQKAVAEFDAVSEQAENITFLN